jgi:hypothetical protein
MKSSFSNIRTKKIMELEQAETWVLKKQQEILYFLDADDYYLPNRFDAEKTV